jgi:hypothetical protein
MFQRQSMGGEAKCRQGQSACLSRTKDTAPDRRSRPWAGWCASQPATSADRRVPAACPIGQPTVVSHGQSRACESSDNLGRDRSRSRPKHPDTEEVRSGGWPADRKITLRKWARGSGPGPGAVIGPGQGQYWSGGPGEGDGEAERLDLPDVVAQLAVGVEAGLVVAGAEVGKPGFGVTETGAR